MKKFLMFDLLITPWILRISYWILQLIIIVIVIGLTNNFNDANQYYSNLGFSLDSLRPYFPGLWWLFLIVSSIFLRIVFESIIVIFKISENSSQIKYLIKNLNIIEEEYYPQEEDGDNEMEDENEHQEGDDDYKIEEK